MTTPRYMSFYEAMKLLMDRFYDEDEGPAYVRRSSWPVGVHLFMVQEEVNGWADNYNVRLNFGPTTKWPNMPDLMHHWRFAITWTPSFDDMNSRTWEVYEPPKGENGDLAQTE